MNAEHAKKGLQSDCKEIAKVDFEIENPFNYDLVEGADSYGKYLPVPYKEPKKPFKIIVPVELVQGVEFTALLVAEGAKASIVIIEYVLVNGSIVVGHLLSIFGFLVWTFLQVLVALILSIFSQRPSSNYVKPSMGNGSINVETNVNVSGNSGPVNVKTNINVTKNNR